MFNIFLFYFLNKFTFFYAIFIGIMKLNGITPIQISMVIISQELTKVFTSSYTGALADKYGVRKVMAIGLIIKVIGSVFWFFSNTFVEFAMAISIIGLGSSCVLGKIDAFLYNSLLSLGKIDKFRNVLLITTVIEAIASVLAGIVIKAISSYALLSMLSIFIIMAFNVPFMVLIMSDPLIVVKKYVKETPLQIVIIAKNIVLQNRQILYFTILSALPVSLMMLCSDLYKMVIADLNLSVAELGNIYSLAHFLPAIISIIFLFVKKLNSAHAIGIIMCGMVSFVGSAFFYSKVSIFVIVVFIGFLPICNSLFRNVLESLISSDLRATITSFISLITAFVNVVGFLLIGLIAKFFGYNVAIACVALFFLSIVFVISKNIIDL